MSYTLRGRLESRLAALVAPLAVALALAGALGEWWPVELCGLMAGIGLAADLVYHPTLPYQPGWAALPLGALELSLTYGAMRALAVPAPLPAALGFYAGAWVWSQLLAHAVLPLARREWSEDGGELGRAGAALAAGFVLPFVASGGVWWHNLPPTVRLSAGIHHGPLYVDRREQLVGAPGAVVLGGIVVRHSDVSISHVTVVGGENGITIDDVDNVVLRHVTVRGAKLDGIHVRRAAVAIHDCEIDMRGQPYGQGIDISFNYDRGMSMVKGCTIVGGQEGIVTHSSMTMVEHNDVRATTLRGITMTEMSMGEIEHNTVQGALGIGVLCGDRSMCTIKHNVVSGTRHDPNLGGALRAGIGVEVWFESEATLGDNELGGNGRRVGVFQSSIVSPRD
jgi:hypothetical protein